MDLPLVSIITVSKNSEKFIENTICSVINQSYPKIEYLIIDSLSEDKTVDIISDTNFVNPLTLFQIGKIFT